MHRKIPQHTTTTILTFRGLLKVSREHTRSIRTRMIERLGCGPATKMQEPGSLMSTHGSFQLVDVNPSIALVPLRFTHPDPASPCLFYFFPKAFCERPRLSSMSGQSQVVMRDKSAEPSMRVIPCYECATSTGAGITDCKSRLPIRMKTIMALDPPSRVTAWIKTGDCRSTSAGTLSHEPSIHRTHLECNWRK